MGDFKITNLSTNKWSFVPLLFVCILSVLKATPDCFGQAQCSHIGCSLEFYVNYVALNVQAGGSTTILSLFWMVLTINFCMILIFVLIMVLLLGGLMVDKMARMMYNSY